jgi:alkane 1-monooxygenase
MDTLHGRDLRFALAWALPWGIGAAALHSPWTAWAVALGVLSLVAVLEWAVPAWRHSPPAREPHPWFTACLRLHVLWQAGLLVLGLLVARDQSSAAAVVALGLAMGMTAGSQGITFAHELGHSRSRLDRALAWGLMVSVGYAHFMVEHYRGHHVRAAMWADPASARAGESLWRFLPRTLAGSWRSAWALEAQRLAQHQQGWMRSPLVWAVVAQGSLLLGAAVVAGWQGLLFWLVQAAHAVWLLETVNYIEHYGLQRREVDGRPERFGVAHAWNADHLVSNCLLANLQRHSDHHMHAWKPYASLEPLPGPQLPGGYASCIYLAMVPPLWFRVMHPRLARWQPEPA